MISQIEKYDPTLSLHNPCSDDTLTGGWKDVQAEVFPIQHVYLFSLYSKNGNSTTVTFQRISQFDTIPPNFI